ncbi:hypothetical protein QE152_g9721 [Popillia japonica]|uniref:Transposase n=1 Tax=Popillia japonica TaxID=7064 RepID=A0AAW1LY64_POPJA
MGRALSQQESSLETRGHIVGLAAAGVPQRQIAKQVGLSERQVRRWLRRSEEEGERPLKKNHCLRKLMLQQEYDFVKKISIGIGQLSYLQMKKYSHLHRTHL